MRGSPFLAALLLTSLLAVPPTASQASPPAPLLTDPSGDLQITAAGSPVAPDAGAAYSGADLRALAITETRTEFLFTVTVEDLKPADEETAPDGLSSNIYFTHNGREFRVETGRGLAHLATIFWGYVYARDSPTAEWDYLWYTFEEVRTDFEADTITIPVARDLLADAEGSAPFPGRTLQGIRVEAGSVFRDSPLITGLDPVPDQEFPTSSADDMPDDPAAAVSYAVQLGLAQTGHARLSSDLPFRASNGEATTYILNATAANLGDAADTFTFAVTGASDRLTAFVPVQVLALEPKARHDVPVLVTVPFGHQHGDVESFVLEMTSESDPGSVGRLEMGVRFLAVPQPAGHHDTLYLHLSPPTGGLGPALQFTQGFLSTLEDDPSAAPGNYYSSSSGGGFGGWTYYFFYRLQPALQMGLDMDLARTGRLALPIGTTQPMLGTTVEGELYVWSPESQDYTEVIVLEPGEPVDIGPNSQHLFEADIVATEAADRIPFEKGMQLYLSLRVTTLSSVPTFGLADEGAYIPPGGSLRLPINEWHDPVDDVLASLAGPGLSPLGAQERLVNPGEAAVFQVSIANPSDETVAVLLEVSGPNAGWATLPSSRIEVPAHDTARASVVVRAPAGAVAGERADLVLQAFSKDDPAARGLLRFVTVVDTSADHPDDTAVADDLSRKESPAPGALLLAVALLALALRRRSP